MKPPAPRLCDRCREACKQPEGTFVLRCGWYAAMRVDGHPPQNAQDGLGRDESLLRESLDGSERNGDSRRGGQ